VALTSGCYCWEEWLVAGSASYAWRQRMSLSQRGQVLRLEEALRPKEAVQ
jgi:hypothetical protein